MNGSRWGWLVGPIAVTALVALVVVGAAAGETTVAAQTRSAALDAGDLVHARAIRSEATARYAGTRALRLAVTESSSTDVIESFTLMSADMMEERIVPADNGIYYAICPRGATCPYPARRFARPAAAFLPRRLALELALRTFLETSAAVVAVSLPTPRFVLFVVQREDLEREVEMTSLAETLSGDPARVLAASLQRTVDQVTRPRVFVALDLVPSPNGRDSLMCVARWPSVTSPRSLAAAATGSAPTAPPANPELNPLFAAEWWLRGHASLPDWTGKPGSSDGVDATGAWQSSTGEASSSRSPTAVSTP